jgi:hypothetical protein
MNFFVKCAKHFTTIMKHKYYVFIECCKMGIPLQGIVHDLSKLRPSEFWSSAKYWTGKGSPVEAERDAIGYSLAWRYHKGRQKHHWQWWIDPDGWDEEGRVKLNPAPMPDKYIKEMVCDMRGAAKAYNSDAIKYYLSKQKEWVLHPDTKKKFEILLGVMPRRFIISAISMHDAKRIAKEEGILRDGYTFVSSDPKLQNLREEAMRGLRADHPDYLIGYYTQAERKYLLR